jgi:hypothetical protein
MKKIAWICLIAYLVAQTFQQYVFAVLPPPTDEIARWRMALEPLNQARALLLLLSFFALAVAFIVICSWKGQKAPTRAAAACVFLLMFCFFEISYRSVELLVVDGMLIVFIARTDVEAGAYRTVRRQ